MRTRSTGRCTQRERRIADRVEAPDHGDLVAVADLFRDELARGWIPRQADIDAALALVRARRTDRP